MTTAHARNLQGVGGERRAGMVAVWGGAVSSWVIAACSRWGAGSLGAVAIRMSNYGLRVRAWISADFRVCRFSRRKYLSSPCMLPGGDSYILVGASVGASTVGLAVL